MTLTRFASILLILLALLPACGCDPLTRHKALSTIFDGVPSLPPPRGALPGVRRKTGDRPGGRHRIR